MNRLMICAMALAMAAPAVSFAADTAPVAKVRFSDLDLTNANDAARMVRRMDVASASVCGASKFSLREMQRAVRESDCYRQSMDRAMADLGSPTVNAVYRERAMVVASN